MANKNPRIGFRPNADAKGQINTRTIAISASNTVPLFPGSLYYVSGGKALGLTAAYADDGDIAGTIVRLYNDDGCTVQNCLASVSGFNAEVTFEEKQEYVSTFDDASFADDGTDNGKFYNCTDEAATGNANGLDGDPYSQRTLEGASEAASAKQFAVSRKTGTPGNEGGVAGTEVYCTINPANWQSW